MIVEFKSDDNGIIEKVLSLSDGTINNNIYISYSAVANTIYLLTVSGGVTQSTIVLTLNQAENNKICIKYKENDVAVWANGFKLGVDTVGITPIGLNDLSLQYPTSAVPFYGNTKQIQYFDSALNDTELETLTSWTSFSEMATSQLYTIE